MSIRLTKIYVENFKSIKKLSTSLSYTNVFFGKNAAGKSAILKAIYYALEGEKIQKDDVFAIENEPFDKNKRVIIDLCFEPEDKDANEFDEEWKNAIGKDNIGKLSGRDRECFAFRTVYTYREPIDSYGLKHYVIKEYKQNGESEVGDILEDGVLILHLGAYYLNSSHDANENLKERDNQWKRMLKFLELSKKIDKSILPEEIKKDIENIDHELAAQLIKDRMKTESSGTASILVFETLKKQIETVYQIMKTFHAICLFEEPEAHLHPQAQMQIVNLLNQIPGQKYIATHSSYIINRFPIHKLVRVVNDGDGSKIYKFDNRLSMKELKTINLKCLLYKAEMVFANKVILFEGQTEHIALPLYFKKHFDAYPFESGYSFVYVEGSNNYKAYLEICNAFNIDWYIYSDGEQVVIDFLNNMMKQITGKHHYDVTKDNHFVIIKNNMCYEDDLIYHGFEKDVSEAIDANEKRENYIKNYMNSFSWQQFKRESKKYIPGVEDYKQALSYYSKRHKIDLAEKVAKTICKNHDENSLPGSVMELFRKIK